MSRKVFISSDISYDENLDEVASENALAALLWPWFLTCFDDWGRSEASPRRLKNKVFPGNELVTPDVIAAALQLYQKHDLLMLYEVDGKQYMAVDQEKWFKYQTHIRREKREKDSSRHPAPEEGAYMRADARDDAKPRADDADCTPSPSPSPSLSNTAATTDAPADAKNSESGQQDENSEGGTDNSFEDLANAQYDPNETTPLKELEHAYCKLHGIGEWNVTAKDFSCMQSMIAGGMPVPFIIETMTKIHAARSSQGHRIKSFTYYRDAIIDAWQKHTTPAQPIDLPPPAHGPPQRPSTRRQPTNQRPAIPVKRADAPEATDDDIERIKALAARLRGDADGDETGPPSSPSYRPAAGRA